MTTVLLVEDDPAISEPLARAFGREGYAVRVHGTGKGGRHRTSPSFLGHYTPVLQVSQLRLGQFTNLRVRILIS